MDPAVRGSSAEGRAFLPLDNVQLILKRRLRRRAKSAGSGHAAVTYIIRLHCLRWMALSHRVASGAIPCGGQRQTQGAVSGEAAIRPLIAKAVQLMSKPPETTHYSHEWRRVATWGFANGAQTTRADSLTIAASGLRVKGRLSFKTGVFGAIEPPKSARRGSASKCGVQAAVERRGGAPPETAAIGLESSVRTP